MKLFRGNPEYVRNSTFRSVELVLACVERVAAGTVVGRPKQVPKQVLPKQVLPKQVPPT